MIAIVSHLKDYTLCYHINHTLDLDLIKYDDLVALSGSDGETSFSWYYFKDEINGTVYYLLGNKCEAGNLLHSQKSVDYFLLVKNPVVDELLKSIIWKLRKVSNISAAFEINMQQQKNMDALLESIELHELEFVK